MAWLPGTPRASAATVIVAEGHRSACRAFDLCYRAPAAGASRADPRSCRRQPVLGRADHVDPSKGPGSRRVPLAVLLRGRRRRRQNSAGRAAKFPSRTTTRWRLRWSDAQPGDHIVLADGDLWTRRRPHDAPPAASRGSRSCCARHGRSRARLAALGVEADDVVLAGLALTTGCAVGGRRRRVERCRFEDTDGIALNVSGGRGVTVELLRVRRLPGRGLSIDPNGKADAVSEPHIHHNYFADFVGTEGDNAHEALQIGQFGGDALLRSARWSRTTCSSESASTPRRSRSSRRATLSAATRFWTAARGRPIGSATTIVWHANWIENCRGMWIYGAGHELAGNRVVGSRDGLCLMAGNTTPDAIRCAQGAERQGRRDLRPHCQDVTLIGNEADHLVVGKVIKAERRGVHHARCPHPHRRA